MPGSLDTNNLQNGMVRIVYEDPWDWQDFAAVGIEVLEIMDRANGTIDMIVDFARSKQIPTGLPAALLRHTSEAGPLTHARSGKLIIVATARVYIVGFRLYERLFPQFVGRVALVASLEDAYAALASPEGWS